MSNEQVHTRIVFPNDVNPLGALFGGTAVAWMDQAAAICALREAGKPVVTAAIDKVEFSLPIRVGDLVEVRARVHRWGRHSVAVEVDLVRLGPRGTKSELCTRGLFHMVAVDETGRPVLIREEGD